MPPRQRPHLTHPQALDSPTSGLDSVTAARVMRYCVDWAHQTQGVLVTTLQQPGPETYNMFDEASVTKGEFQTYG